MTTKRKRSSEYYRGREDARNGAGPDYGQATVALMLDYMAGYRRGRREKRTAPEREA